MTGVELRWSAAHQSGTGFDLHDPANHHVRRTCKAHSAHRQIGVIEIEHAARLHVDADQMLPDSGRGKLRRFVRNHLVKLYGIMGRHDASVLPILWESGIGSDVVNPIAAPIVGSMVTSTIHVLILAPVFLFL